MIEGKMIIGFLVGYDGKKSVIETLTGKLLHLQNIDGKVIAKQQDYDLTANEEISYENGWKVFTRKDGKKYSVMCNNRL